MRLIAAFLITVACASADTLSLKSGRLVEGTYLGGSARQIRMAVGDRVEAFEVSEVLSLKFSAEDAPAGKAAEPAAARPLDPAPAAASPAPTPAAPPVPAAPVAAAPPVPAAPVAAAPAAPAPVPKPAEPVAIQPGTPSVAKPAEPVLRSERSAASRRGPIELPAGTPVVVRMIDDIDSQRDRVGQSFRASLDEPVVVNGETVVPRGADVAVKLVDDKESGKLSGRAELSLALVSMAVDGRTVDLVSQEVTQASESRTGRTAKVVGGTAAVGAVIGAIAGGGRGAAIGAASGAAVGGAAQIMTKGQRVRIPSESRLQFTLQYPVKI